VADLVWGLRRHGYRAVERERARRGGPDDFPASMLGRRAAVLRSDEGVRAFYDATLVRRADAVPAPLKNLLFGRGAVHGLDDDPHAARKDLLRGLLGEPDHASLVRAAADDLERRSRGWHTGGVTVHGECVEAYGVAALSWAGLLVPPGPAIRLSHELARIVDGFGGAVPAYPRAWLARLGTDRWFRARVEDVRQGRAATRSGSALGVLAAAPLPARVAAVELGNLVRPTVAVSWLATDAALELARRPEWRERLATDEVGRDHVAFAQEVRRLTPFVPVLAGRLRRDAELAGVRLREGDRLVLDVRGVSLDPARWTAPESFDPDRFREWSPGPFDLVPQGGGDVSGHRCPGESLTIRLLAETARVLARARFRVEGAAGLDLSRIPTLPGRGLPLAPCAPATA
jgi:fatty-acid peroxygenase